MRNEWGLWHGSKLAKCIDKIYFEKWWREMKPHFEEKVRENPSADWDVKKERETWRKIRYCHPDAMSSYIIEAFHRHLNERDYKDLKILG